MEVSVLKQSNTEPVKVNCPHCEKDITIADMLAKYGPEELFRLADQLKDAAIHDYVNATSNMVEQECIVCGKKFMGLKPSVCCSGRDCGCMGMPIDPQVCSDECYETRNK